MGALLLICRPEAAAQADYTADGRVDWSRALPVVLEKHGLLAVEIAGPEALEDRDRLQAAGAVIVTPLAPEAWTDAAVETVIGAPASMLLEAPLPARLMRHIGISASGSIDLEGGIVAGNRDLHQAAADYGAAPGASLAAERVTALVRDPQLDWTALERIPLDPRQADAWGRPGWSLEAWTVTTRPAVLCEWVGREHPYPRRPAIVRHGHLTAACFGLSAFLAQRHSMHPYGGPEWLTTDRTIGLETILLALLDQMHRRAGKVRLRVLPWPQGRRWARTVRQDVLAPTAEPEIRSFGEFLDRGRAASTLYWASTVPSGPAAAAVEAGVEVALCAEQLWAAPRGEERTAVEAGAGAPLRGASARGSSHCFRHQGAPNVLWAQDEGFDYSELAGRSHAHPHRFPALASDGVVRPLDVLCLPAPESLRHLAGDASRLTESIRWWSGVGGMLQLTLPPGPPGPELADVLARMPAGECWDVTAAEAIDWWRRSHVELSVRATAENAFELSAPRPVEGLTVEILRPDGRLSEQVLNVGPEPVQVNVAAGQKPDLVSWDDTRPMFRRALRRAYGTGSADEDNSVVGAQIHATAAGRERGEMALRTLAEAAGRESLAGSRLLDAGCGFGALSLYLGWRAEPEAALGVDLSEVNITVASAVATEARLASRVQFAAGELEALPVDDGAVDVAFVVGVLMYMPSGRRLRAALRELRRVLDGGGTLYVYQANRWRLRDPMSGRPLTHLLPRWLARLVDRDPSSVGKRWISAFEMMWRLRRLGFRNVRLESYATGGRRRVSGIRRHWDEYYAVTASVPGEPREKRRLPRAPLSRQPVPAGWDEITALVHHEAVAALRDGCPPADGAARRVTLRAETVLAPERARVLFEILEATLGVRSLAGATIVHLGSGFGGLTAYLARIAQPECVLAVDPQPRAVEAMRRIALAAGMDECIEPRMLPLDAVGDLTEARADVLVASAILRELDEDALGRAVAGAHRVLKPGGVIVVYDVAAIPGSVPAVPPDLLPGDSGGDPAPGRPATAIDPDALARRLEATGFSDVTAQRFPVAADLAQDADAPGEFFAVAGRRS